MTDNEIIKALECCVIEKSCMQCPANKLSIYPDVCKQKLVNIIIDLINRKEAEIERLQRENNILSKNADTAFQDGLNEAQDLYAEQVKAEIKREDAEQTLKGVKVK